MKKLCFGSFVTVLVHCKPKRTTQKKLCGTILLSINPEYDIRDEDGTTSGLVKGNDNLSSVVTDAIPKDNFSAVSDYFKKEVIPMLDANRKNTLILALKEIIAEDNTIQTDTVVEMVNGFSKSDVAERTSFVLADFLAGLFLYTVANVENRGCEEAVNEITAEFISSLDLKKANVSMIAAYSKFGVEFAKELAIGAVEVAMLTETGGNCQICGSPLGIKNDGKSISYATQVRLSDTDDIVVCANCARELHNLSEDDKSMLISDKHSLEAQNIARDAISRHQLDGQILEVLEAIHDMDVTEETKLKIEPIKVERKITEKRLKDRVLQDVTQLYDGVNSALDFLSGENRLNVDKFAKGIKRKFEDASETLVSQSDIYYALVEDLYVKCGRKHRPACEVIISYFVQSCEVFNEITE